jgi:Mg-chelatase subunit ChlD/tetratricopeptide (TPR) repeat protein
MRFALITRLLSTVRTVLALAVLSLVVFGIWFVSRRQPPPKASGTIEARVELAAGNVTIARAGQTRRVNSGTALPPDSMLETAVAARALLRLQDGSVAFVRDATKVLLETRGLSLESGELFVNAAPAEQKTLMHRAGEVQIAASEAGYSLSRAGGNITVTVTRGTVTVAAPGGRVEVHAGQSAVVAGAEAPKTGPVSYFDDWTGGMADLPALAAAAGTGAGSIYGVDASRAAGSAPQRLDIQKQSVRVVLRDEMAETEVDQTFLNPGERDVEGWYWFQIPDNASVTGFALETNNVLVEGELIERKAAAGKYTEARSSGHSPAILEWINATTVRARIFPIESGGTRRVVIRYIELRPIVEGKLSYVYPMGSGEATRVGEFSLSVDLGKKGRQMQIATLAEARIEDGGERVTIRRSGYTPRAPFQLEATLKEPRPALSVARFAAGGERADYLLARFTPDLDWSQARSSRADIVVVVDTSGGGDESSRALKVRVAEATLRALGGDDRFALMSLDVMPKVLFPATGLASAKPEAVSEALQKLAEHATGGATDLGAGFDVALERLHGTDQPAVVLISDGKPTSGELMPEKLIERLRRALDTSRARFFTVGIGTDANPALLEALAQIGGGQLTSIANNDETTLKALELTAAIRTPTLTDLEINLGAGLDDAVSNVTGKLSQGQEYLLLARTHHELPTSATIRGRLGGKEIKQSLTLEKESGPLSRYAPRLWAAEQIRRRLARARSPEDERGQVIALGLEYGLMTPFTSFLALESEAAYAEMGVKRRSSPLRPARLSSIEDGTVTSNPGAFLPLLTGCSREESAPAAANKNEQSAQEGKGDNPVSASDMATPPPAPEMAMAVVEQPANGEEIARAAAATRAAGRPEEGRSFGMIGLLGAEPNNAQSGLRKASVGGSIRPGQVAPQVSKPKPPPASSTPADPRRILSKVALGICSDLSRRSLTDRIVFWDRRLVTARSAEELLERYATAKKSCELSDWLAERTFLGLLESRLVNEGFARQILTHFSDQPDVRNFIAARLLRRSTDARMTAVVREVLFGGAVDWLAVDRTIQGLADPEKRLLELRKALALSPSDPEGNLRLLRELVRAGRTAEALSLGQRVKQTGLLTPALMRRIGDLLAGDKQAENAQRVYSELVEFSPDDWNARQMLGDIYLANRWFDQAYRQYQLLTELKPDVPVFWLRMAMAAAGAGRTDEALRIERRVSVAEGTPGPSDPRRFARLLAANHLGTLLLDAKKGTPGPQSSTRMDSLSREFKELNLFSSPGRLLLVTWLDPMTDLLLSMLAERDGVGVGENTDAASIGLQAAWLSTDEAAKAKAHLTLRSSPSEYPVEVTLTFVDWDGKAFQIERRTVTLPAGATSIDE